MKTETIEQVVTIPAKPEEVYQGFVDPEIHTAMTGGRGDRRGQGRRNLHSLGRVH